jgi:hypothetical protein
LEQDRGALFLKPKWHAWAGRVAGMRSKDELLCYLAQARGADEPPVGDVVEQKPGH